MYISVLRLLYFKHTQTQNEKNVSPIRMANKQKIENEQVLIRIRKHSCATGRNVEWYNHCLK